ncbi:MAG: nascent polypeptide-associated complex protein [Candidatus Woesearchaeota archaeon]|nr:nascent polypeptide-associated complex protein [Candidatus Woesearchaeota archaeon]
MKQMMKQMGIKQVDYEASRVIIECPDKKIIVENPQVSKVNMMGQDTWQVVGASREESLDTSAEINEEDVQTVVDQTNVSAAEAKAAIEAADGDLAEAIMKLSE